MATGKSFATEPSQIDCQKLLSATVLPVFGLVRRSSFVRGVLFLTSPPPPPPPAFPHLPVLFVDYLHYSLTDSVRRRGGMCMASGFSIPTEQR
ncbi:hypothetical protein CDAR_597071 [Caerostris darwini]|uniref:Uncharacterized protein n=1 Tax=Caerostris darwini TaxID=1538125 RepID=A0AAV4U2G6_9ARAC|nr:hypothetical protein CDAR_597071 [Caerostris darwini]